jgi:hypothetical protein
MRIILPTGKLGERGLILLGLGTVMTACGTHQVALHSSKGKEVATKTTSTTTTSPTKTKTRTAMLNPSITETSSINPSKMPYRNL